MPPKKGKTAQGHVKCDPIPVGTIYKGTNKREVIVGKEFAQGGFGRICDAKLVDKADKLIIKLEPSGNGPLFTEMHVFQRIFRADMLEAYKKKQKLTHLGLPYLVESGMQEEIRFLVMPKYSYCLDHIIKESRAPLKLENVVDILICVSNALKYIHDNDYVHADIKAANIMMNKKNGFNEVYLIDFGLARKVGTVVEKEDKKKAHDGTALFTSTDAHRGCGFTFRGDVEILGHNALFWLTKHLPWKDIFDEDATIKMKNEQLGEVRAAKEELLSNLSTNLKKLIPDSSAASVVQMLYKASKIDINKKPDFDAVLRSLSSVIKGKKKVVAESDSEEAVAPPPTTVRRGRKPLAQDDDSESAPPPPSSSRTTRKKKSDSDSEDYDPPPSAVRRVRKPVTRDDDSESAPPPPSSSRTTRKKKSDSDSEDYDPPPSAVRRGRKPVTRDESIPPTEIPPPTSSRTTRKKKSESDIEELDPPARRKAKLEIRKQEEEEPTPAAPKSTRRGRGAASDSEIPSSSKKSSRPRQISENEIIIPGLKTKNAGKAAMPSHQEEESEEIDKESSEEEKPLSPPKSSRRYPATPKIPPAPRSKIETPKISSTKSYILPHGALPTSNTSTSLRKNPDNDSSPSRPIKKSRHEFNTLKDNLPKGSFPTPQSSSSRTRSNDSNLFSPRLPSTSNHHQYYKNTEPKPKTPLIKHRSRSFENTPPTSPEYLIRAIPQPQGCNII